MRSLKAPWTLAQRKTYFQWLRKAYKRYEGGESFRGFVKQTLTDSLRTLSGDAKNAVAEIFSERETQNSGESQREPRRFIHNWQRSDLVPRFSELNRGRSFEKGKQAFLDAQCNRCHRMHGQGANTGPDLTGVGSRFSAEYLLDAILDPSKVIPEQYRGLKILTSDGNVIIGHLVEQKADELILRTDPYSEENTVIQISDIESQTPSKVSEMPTGLINTLSADEILDLIAYMRSGGNPDDEAFSEPSPESDPPEAIRK